MQFFVLVNRNGKKINSKFKKNVFKQFRRSNECKFQLRLEKFHRQRENFKRISSAGSETTTKRLFFRSLQHLTRARVFHGLEYCFFASFPLLLLLMLSLLYVFPHIKHFPTRALSIVAMCQSSTALCLWIVFVGVPRNCFLSIAIVLQLQSHDGKRQSEQNG